MIAAQLTNASGGFVPDGSFVTLLSLGTSGVLTAPTSSSFVSGTEQLIAGFSLQSSTVDGSPPGSFDHFVSGVNLSGPNFVAGQQLAIEWFPTLSAASNPTAPGAGTSFGSYTDPTWLVPSDSGFVSYLMQTVSAGGPVLNSDGQATQTVGGIPEPSTYALLGGLAALGLAASRRRARG